MNDVGKLEREVIILEDMKGPSNPCPFCGRLGALFATKETGGHRRFSIECDCGASGPKGRWIEQAIEEWDKRS